jgi:hypothetical protein
MKSQYPRFSFSSGVMSPRLSMRADIQQFESAQEYNRNWIVTPQGGVIFRQGFEYLNEAAQGRIFQFHQGGNESDILIEVSGGIIKFWGDSSITDQAYNDIILDFPYPTNDDIYFVNQERYAILVHPAVPPLYLELVNGQFTAELLSSTNIPDYDFKDGNSPGTALNLDDTYTLTWTPNWATTDKKWYLTYDGVRMSSPDEREYSTVGSGMETKLNKALLSIPELNQSPDTSYAATWVSELVMTINIIGPGAGKELKIERTRDDPDWYVEVTRANVLSVVYEKAWSYPTYVLHGGIYYQCILPHSAETGTNEPPNATYWTALAEKPATFDWQYFDNETQLSENDWLNGVTYYPGGRGFPRVCCFHQQRLILAGTPSATTALWGSGLNNYKNFKGGAESDDPFAFTLDTSDTPAIKWMTSQIQLMIGTSAGDWRVFAEVTLGPGDILAQKQNNARSYNTLPVSVNVNVLYIEQGNTKIRGTTYSDELNSFSSTDLTIMAENLFHEGIKRLALLQNPETLIVALRNDGKLCALTYGDNIGAWTELQTDGFIHDIAAYYSTVTNEDELWVQIDYDYDPMGPDPEPTWKLERMPYPSRTYTPYSIPPGIFVTPTESLTQQGVICMDSWVRGTLVVGTNIISGLDHLEGKEVGCTVNDAWAGLYTVTGGIIQLADIQLSATETYAGEYAVGLMYEGNLKTYESAGGYQRGTGLGTTRRWNKLYCRTLDSALPIINGTLPPDRDPQALMGIADVIQVGLLDSDVRTLGWDQGAITIVQDRPYPTHILGFFGEFNANNI